MFPINVNQLSISLFIDLKFLNAELHNTPEKLHLISMTFCIENIGINESMLLQMIVAANYPPGLLITN